MFRSLTLFFALACFSFAEAQSRWQKVREELLFSAPPFKACHASTIVEDQEGEISLACFAGSQEGKSDVSIYYGAVPAKGQMVPAEVATGVDSARRYPCWNPVLFKKTDGQLVLFYKVGPSPREWWGMYKTSKDHGLHWSAAVRLPENFLGPIKNKPVQLQNGEILCPSSIELGNGHWKVQMEVTDLNLKKWSAAPVDTASAFDVIQPSILSYVDGRLQILCRSKQGNIIQSWSTDKGHSWSDLSKTSLLNPNSGIDAVTLKDGRQLLVYNPELPGKDWFNGRAKLRVALSANGVNWQDIMVLEDGTKEEYSYPAIIQTKDGLVHISYTYDRKNIKYVVLKGQK